jgi:phosphoribosylformimino-5-aminoimidazole carboxamide ribotide isomerase
MLLIIPAIDIQNGVSAYPIGGTGPSSAGTDPVAIAKLLRIENAKTLHATDLDGAREGAFRQFDVMKRLVENVDIPIEVSGGISGEETADRILGYGACRVVLHPRVLPDRPDLAERILGKHGPAKVVVAIESIGEPGPAPAATPGSGHPLALAMRAKTMGFRRLLYTELDEGGTRHRLNAALLGELASRTGLRVTVSGGVVSYADLKRLQDLRELGVDSVILRRSLYENNFPCQKIWRMAETGGYPYTAKV